MAFEPEQAVREPGARASVAIFAIAGLLALIMAGSDQCIRTSNVRGDDVPQTAQPRMVVDRS